VTGVCHDEKMSLFMRAVHLKFSRIFQEFENFSRISQEKIRNQSLCNKSKQHLRKNKGEAEWKQAR
jgi:hypothetical protein